MIAQFGPRTIYNAECRMATPQAPLSASFPLFDPPPAYPPSQTPFGGPGETGYFTMPDFSSAIVQIIRGRTAPDQVCANLFTEFASSSQLFLQGRSSHRQEPHELRSRRPSSYMDHPNGCVSLSELVAPSLCVLSAVHTPHGSVISRAYRSTSRRGD